MRREVTHWLVLFSEWTHSNLQPIWFPPPSNAIPPCLGFLGTAIALIVIHLIVEVSTGCFLFPSSTCPQARWERNRSRGTRELCRWQRRDRRRLCVCGFGITRIEI